jgi:hypothetical protein
LTVVTLRAALSVAVLTGADDQADAITLVGIVPGLAAGGTDRRSPSG